MFVRFCHDLARLSWEWTRAMGFVLLVRPCTCPTIQKPTFSFFHSFVFLWLKRSHVEPGLFISESSVIWGFAGMGRCWMIRAVENLKCALSLDGFLSTCENCNSGTLDLVVIVKGGGFCDLLRFHVGCKKRCRLSEKFQLRWSFSAIEWGKLEWELMDWIGSREKGIWTGSWLDEWHCFSLFSWLLLKCETLLQMCFLIFLVLFEKCEMGIIWCRAYRSAHLMKKAWYARVQACRFLNNHIYPFPRKAVLSIFFFRLEAPRNASRSSTSSVMPGVRRRGFRKQRRKHWQRVGVSNDTPAA